MSGLLAASEGANVAVSNGQLGLVAVVAGVAIIALLTAGYLVREVLAASEGTANMITVARAVQEGAQAYLRRQFSTLAIFVVIIPFILLLLPAETGATKAWRSIFFVIGAVFSALVGFVGMGLAVRGNVRVAAAAQESGTQRAMRIAFRTGGVCGMFTVGLGLLGAAVVVLISKEHAPQVLEGFGFGAALLAMFMRVGGGIFTKAADVGADLVGKVEQGIPEDDPRNAATIADNVGDNVGDCAGMAADLFESYAVTLVAALILGKVAFGEKGLVFPLLIPAIGVLTAIVGILLVAPRENDRSGMSAINRGFFISAAISAVLVTILSLVYLPSKFSKLPGAARPRLRDVPGQPAGHRHRRGAHRSGPGGVDPAADRLLHRDHPSAGPRHRQGLPDRSCDQHPGRHQRRPRVRGLLRAAHRCRGVRRLPARPRLGHGRAVRGRPGRLPVC